MTDEVSDFVQQYLAHGDEWARSLYEAVGRVTVSGAAVEGALFSLAMQLAPSDDLYGARIDKLRSVIENNRGELSRNHRKLCAQLLGRASDALRRRNFVVHLAWNTIPFHQGQHLGVGIRKAPSGQGLLGSMKSTKELQDLGAELHDVAASISTLQHNIATA
ncbi:hypothetical protein EXE58_08980 [Nocardioides seonyuensis]|uniref:Uncharacterized protein n=1 Tax=Nocardioides seonyuensis TaxID=2518371 RepID=A0A4P7IG23_9ACTN|nr:hypothetical protein [Nocardioides seonyuensis]QBX55573.1 hypothetical protein EXE58_08980 [Nocardioides seonyuensis]